MIKKQIIKQGKNNKNNNIREINISKNLFNFLIVNFFVNENIIIKYINI